MIFVSSSKHLTYSQVGDRHLHFLACGVCVQFFLAFLTHNFVVLVGMLSQLCRCRVVSTSISSSSPNCVDLSVDTKKWIDWVDKDVSIIIYSCKKGFSKILTELQGHVGFLLRKHNTKIFRSTQNSFLSFVCRNNRILCCV